MSELRVDNIVDMGGSGAPQLRKGASVTGISTITQAVVGNATINAGGINATGIVTSSSNKFVGDLASGNITAGVMTATSAAIASKVNINAGGVDVTGYTGIISATSYQGSGANLTGIGLTIAPLMYNPDVGTSDAALTGIGLTFNQRVFPGNGNVTLSLVSVGSTVVENFSVGSSVTYNNDADPPNITITPTSSLTVGQRYAISYPSGAFTQTGAGGSFVGTAYTFTARNYSYQMWIWGNNEYGALGINAAHDSHRSSPVQIPGLKWGNVAAYGDESQINAAVKTDGTLWTWGYNINGVLGQNSEGDHRSSPTQVPGTTWAGPVINGKNGDMFATKTDGTLWAWGYNGGGGLGQNSRTNYSSPVQVGSDTTWPTDIGTSDGVTKMNTLDDAVIVIKTDGTMWGWGTNHSGKLGLNNTAHRSSPTQVPGTWKSISDQYSPVFGVKTDGTAYFWGSSGDGSNGINVVETQRSSPTQLHGGGTTWKQISVYSSLALATKTDGTLWGWGNNLYGVAAVGTPDTFPQGAGKSAPIQIGNQTNWKFVQQNNSIGLVSGLKTDGTLWVWGCGKFGAIGNNTVTPANAGYSSPVQVPGTNWYGTTTQSNRVAAIKQI